MKQQKHNPDYKLISTTIFDGHKFIEMVWSEKNEGGNEGLELYFMKEKNGHFYKSRRYLSGEVPPRYARYFESLQSRKSLVNPGHKLIVNLINE